MTAMTTRIKILKHL